MLHNYGGSSPESSCDDETPVDLDAECESVIDAPSQPLQGEHSHYIATQSYTISLNNLILVIFTILTSNMRGYVCLKNSVCAEAAGATGTVFRLNFLGSVEVDEEGGRKRRKRLKKNMVELAVTKIKVTPLRLTPTLATQSTCKTVSKRI